MIHIREFSLRKINYFILGHTVNSLQGKNSNQALMTLFPEGWIATCRPLKISLKWTLIHRVKCLRSAWLNNHDLFPWRERVGSFSILIWHWSYENAHLVLVKGKKQPHFLGSRPLRLAPCYSNPGSIGLQGSCGESRWSWRHLVCKWRDDHPNAECQGPGVSLPQSQKC